MAAFARWTRLSETTFLLQPTQPGADYRVRIFTPERELPFAGHPTLGSCRAWLAAGGLAHKAGEVTQECAAGLIRIRRFRAEGPRIGTAPATPQPTDRLAFAAPPCLRSGPLAPELVAHIGQALCVTPADILGHQWVDNGPGWCAVRLASGTQVQALQPAWEQLRGLHLGVVAPWQPGEAHPPADAQFEVRAFIGPPADGPGQGYEDPVTGSLNASLGQWLIGSGLAPARYTAAQGHALQRAGRVHLQQEGDTLWVGGDVAACISGTVMI
jgi:PhzF family phenazine biosynthesis protein